jgi:mannose-1-phosphate guanylyltransferase
MDAQHTWAVILAGGFGTRFWPASTRKLPKQFLKVTGKRTLIAETAERMRGVVARERMLVVTGREHASLVAKSLRGLPPENILAEPEGRNTAACVAWAALEIERRDPGSVHVVLPSDQVIAPAAEFRKLLRASFDEAAEGDALLTLGVQPTSPATGYGYIEAGEALPARGGFPVRRVARFVEKPDRARAETFLATGRFLWNAGIFVWSTRAILAAFEQHQPKMLAQLRAMRTDEDRTLRYREVESLPVDVAILERAANVRVMPIAFTWSDVGSWTALPEIGALDSQGNCVTGGARLLSEEALRCIVHGKPGELFALIGVEDLIVVRAGKSILVCPRERAQDVKKVVQRLQASDPAYL